MHATLLHKAICTSWENTGETIPWKPLFYAISDSLFAPRACSAWDDSTRRERRSDLDLHTPQTSLPFVSVLCVASLRSVSSDGPYWGYRKARASLVVQWLRICLPVQGKQVPPLIWEESTCLGAAHPVQLCNSPCAPQLLSLCPPAWVPRACAPQQEKPR